MFLFVCCYVACGVVVLGSVLVFWCWWRRIHSSSTQLLCLSFLCSVDGEIRVAEVYCGLHFFLSLTWAHMLFLVMIEWGFRRREHIRFSLTWAQTLFVDGGTYAFRWGEFVPFLCKSNCAHFSRGHSELIKAEKQTNTTIRVDWGSWRDATIRVRVVGAYLSSISP